MILTISGNFYSEINHKGILKTIYTTQILNKILAEPLAGITIVYSIVINFNNYKKK